MKQFFYGLGRSALLVLLVADLMTGVHAQSSSSVTTAGSEAEPSAPINVQAKAPVVPVSKPAVQSAQDSTAPSLESTPAAPASTGQVQSGAQAAVNGDYVLRAGSQYQVQDW